MFRHILVPTDGSRLAAKGAKAAVKLAAALGARLTAVYVILPYRLPVYGEAAFYYVPGLSPQEYEKSSQQAARKALGGVERLAKNAGVRCATRFLTAAHPYEGILRTARTGNCDAIVMASHGRGGLTGVLLGSETTRVLGHSRIPVVVIR